MEFHERLKKIITENGYNGTKLAREIEISKSAMSGYLKGNNYPTVPVLEKISNKLNVSLDYIIKGENIEKTLSNDELFLLDTYHKLNSKNKLLANEEMKHLLRIQKIENM